MRCAVCVLFLLFLKGGCNIPVLTSLKRGCIFGIFHLPRGEPLFVHLYKEGEVCMCFLTYRNVPMFWL